MEKGNLHRREFLWGLPSDKMNYLCGPLGACTVYVAVQAVYVIFDEFRRSVRFSILLSGCPHILLTVHINCLAVQTIFCKCSETVSRCLEGPPIQTVYLVAYTVSKFSCLDSYFGLETVWMFCLPCLVGYSYRQFSYLNYLSGCLDYFCECRRYLPECHQNLQSYQNYLTDYTFYGDNQKACQVILTIYFVVQIICLAS